MASPYFDSLYPTPPEGSTREIEIAAHYRLPLADRIGIRTIDQRIGFRLSHRATNTFARTKLLNNYANTVSNVLDGSYAQEAEKN